VALAPAKQQCDETSVRGYRTRNIDIGCGE
jgi:hypothetical protein